MPPIFERQKHNPVVQDFTSAYHLASSFPMGTSFEILRFRGLFALGTLLSSDEILNTPLDLHEPITFAQTVERIQLKKADAHDWIISTLT